MLLDAPSFTLNLTPEAALSSIQREIAKRGWKQWEVQEIRLVYVPYYVFSFDVVAEGGQQPTGKAALNANTGELDEFVPTILERPLSRTKQTDEKAKPEVEPTNISRSEVEKVAAVKIGASVGLKRENIAVSAIAKYYFPFYRTWINVGGEAGDSYTINVDALMGAPLGLEAVASKHKTWVEETEFTLDRLKTPSGWFELIGSIPSLLTGGGGPAASILGSKAGRWIVLGAVALVLLFFVFRSPSVSASCVPANAFAGPTPALGLDFLGKPTINPTRRADGMLFVRGTCTFRNNNKEDLTACVRVQALENGVPTSAINNTCVLVRAGGAAHEKEFSLTWRATNSRATYSLEYETQALG